MPWSLSQRDGKWCVIKDSDGSEAGCHVTRADAIKQQRALYANESRMAAMYAELDSEEERVEAVETSLTSTQGASQSSSELVRIEIGKEHDHLIASLADRMDAMTQQQNETQAALVAALTAMSQRDPVVNVAAPEGSVEAPSVTVEPPVVTVEAPNVTVEATPIPEITVRPEINVQLPQSQ